MKIVAIIQAHMESTRLPGKVLMDIAGQPMLTHVVSRTRRAKRVDETIVATSIQTPDDAIVGVCKENGCGVFRGDDADVLDRYYNAAKQSRADAVVRITSDCPLIDPNLIDDLIHTFVGESGLDYASNGLPPRSYPRGLDAEIFGMAALQTAWIEAKEPACREHVTLYLVKHADKFKLRRVGNPVDYSKMRWTVDTKEDLQFVRLIYNHFGGKFFSWTDVLRLLEAHPDWQNVNAGIKQKEVA